MRFNRKCGGVENRLRGDFADRTILINLPEIKNNKRLDEKSLDTKFKELHPVILAGLYDTVATGLKNINDVKLETMPRMADFAKWIRASEPSFNFVESYEENRKEQNEIILDASVVGSAIIDLMETRENWTGTLKQLLDELNYFVDKDKRDQSYPKDATRLSGKLKRDAPALRQAGIKIEFQGHSRKGNIISLVKCEAGEPV